MKYNIWHIKAYAGWSDYDGPSDCNFDKMMIFDASFKKQDIIDWWCATNSKARSVAVASVSLVKSGEVPSLSLLKSASFSEIPMWARQMLFELRPQSAMDTYTPEEFIEKYYSNIVIDDAIYSNWKNPKKLEEKALVLDDEGKYNMALLRTADCIIHDCVIIKNRYGGYN